MEDAQALEDKLKVGMAFTVFHSFFAVAADSELEMLRREEQLKEKLQGSIQLVHPPGNCPENLVGVLSRRTGWRR
ncbi:hypothetical protein GCM10025857_03210 [Alicyclobacillus contaminans]|nr:hypothetical protein GCM10025857_03210 [Alicyclobacillus contaminans]